ncbi:stabilin-2 [Rana temporaria]|uniref:stabilin-2 n=1 Tax=Rana temporaria TaxID=8407 RepID=UPI001AAD1F1B|nr:stabilin-2 [Rana temporaria]
MIGTMEKNMAIPFIVLLSFVCYLPTSAVSIKNEAKNRCEEKNLLTIKTECMSCTLNAAVNCSEGYKKASQGSGQRDCRYFLEIRSYSLSLPGCRHLCTKVETQPKCCSGYWGPECMECPGGASSPCNDRGICADGMGGNGTCICQEKFGGTNCEKCADDDTYGPDCRSVCDCVHGICNSGINGDGKCSCFSGYNGPKCDQPLPDCAVLNCKGNKRCTMSSSGALECKCLPNYEEKGSTCEPINPCLKKVCDAAAYCTYVGPNKHTCTCKEGYRGDGNVCLPIDPCQENFGDCPTASSICKYDGPGQSHCECKEGYSNFQLGIGCNLTDVCATKNTCSKNANCTTISPGQIECTCKKGYVGDGLICYGNILERMKEINKEPGQWQGKLSAAITLFDAYSWQLSSLGPFTVLVPINKGIKARDIKNLIANKENMLYFIKLHMIAGQLNAEDFNTTDLIYTLTGKSGEVSAGEADNELKIRIRGSKKRGTFLAKNLIASNGIIHIIDKAMDFVEPTLESNTKETIMEILLENGRYNRFRSLLEKSNLGPDLEKDGPYTVFVPNNDALSGMENGTLEYLLSREGSWKLLELMRYHIVSSAELDVANIISSSQIMSMANQMIQFNTTSNGQILVNGEEVEEADVAAKNGRIYTLDGVLIPPSILPILPHRCDENTYKIILGTCISCSLVLFSKCPEGSTTTSLFTHKCFYRNSIMGSDYPRIGCSRYCNATVPVPKCCKGFFGPECKPCPGGFTNSCFGNGECMDGMTGSGICVCDEAFTGPDCRRCKDSNMYGPRCDTKCNCLHGRCNNHIDSDGSCLTASCTSGYTGRFCDMKTTPCGPLVTYCHAHAECEYSKKTPNCVCKPGFEGDGFHCKETNPCLNSENRLCSVNAECIPLGSGAHKCVCRTGWTGDGLDCSEINNCLLENKGGCHVNATCVYIGPGQSDCECNKGFRGDGIQCEAVNTCLEEKDKCHALATCKKAISGFWECVCNEGYQGDGKICYGNVADVIASLPEGSEFHKWTEDPAIRSLISSSSNVTVFVPSQKAFESMSEQDKSYWMRKDKMPILLKYHILPDVFRSDDIKNLSSSDMLATALKNNFLKLSKDNGTVTVGGAKIIAGDIAAVNGVVHLVDKVLTPEPLLAGVMPDLMTRLDQMPDYSIFRGYIIEYKLANVIEESETYTVFAPHNDAITTYIRNKGQATLDENTMRYHIILGQQLMKNDMHEGMHRETLLGFSYQIGFFMRNGELVVNDAPLNYTNAATDKGVIQGIGKVLEIQKNRCDNNDTAVSLSKCGDCLSVLSICESNAKPVPSVRKPCVYSKYSLRKKFLFIGCQTLCVKTVITKECCSGFYGQQCLSCPGKAGNPCFGNGVCLDGFNGTGVCRCEEGFTGTACESCVVGKYGPRCDQACACVNGKCSEGITGDGSCACNVGWRGVKCDTAITEDKCNKACHTSANCLEKAGGTAYCQCASGFQGNGTMCTVIDACATSNGGCSAFAECRKTTPGDRNCVCKQGYTGDGIVCLEIDPCVLNNGGCDQNAECTKTGPNQSVCNCLQGYNGDGQKCKPINPCLTKNGGCSEYATCNHTGPAERTCTCKSSYIGDGIICKGNIYEELRKNTNTSNFFYLLQANVLNELSTTGPFTVFVPTNDALKNDPRTNEWTSKGMMEQVLLYHILSCAQLTKEDLSTMTSFTSLQGEKVTVASSQNTLVLNGDAKLASGEEMIVLNNGVVHLIDKVLAPKKMQQRPTTSYDILKNVAESNGYNTIFKLLQDAELMKLIDDPVHRPVTLFLPTDEAIRDLPQEQRDFLFNNQNKDKLIQNLKYHIVRDAGVTANDLIIRGSIKTLQGSDLSVKCGDKDSTTGDIFMDNRQCKIIQRQLLFDGGIAYGIDCLLTPISLGGRCDSLVTMDMSGDCGMCFNVPKCPSGSKPKGQKTKCQYELSSRRSIQGCRQECSMVLWMAKCCKGYYGRDCQACPGSPEIPCNKHGTCDEGYTGTGECRCSPEFNGTACELCMPGRYGPDCKLCDCTENGQCDEGITGNGECSCKRGWIGKRCETKLDLPPVCTPPCNRDAVCKRDKTCECKKFYEGDGRTCKVINLCQANNGGCDKNAKCSQSGVKVTCSCLKGYSGDGTVCTPINPCADGLNGGCHEHAICTITGPDKRKCECKDQYIGDGVTCDLKEAAIDRCMQDNGQCHTDALCADLHYLDTKVGVFHLRSPKGTYKYTYSEATQACKDEDGTLATYKQLAYAQQANYHYCAAGWLAEARVGYPTAFPNPNCGSGYVGIVDYGVRTNMSETWDVFCYRYKDVQCTCKPGYVGDGYQCNGNLLQMLMSFPEFSNFLLEIFKYSNSSVKGKEFVSYLSDLSIQATLFAPSNDGLNENMTLSGRDIEYHIANVSTVFFVDLSNGTSLQTRLGDKLLILFGDTSSDTQTKDQTRYVGGKRIIQWDYIASNGIIHTISEPLKAPPTPIALHAGHGAGIFFGIVFIVGLLALAIYAYKKKFNRKDFQFQQFHEDEDKPSVSVSEFDTEPSSNIANPMYESATTATTPAEPTSDSVYHPFSDSDDQQLVSFSGRTK